MCLITKYPSPKIAKRDITVYKIVENRGIYGYTAPYMGTPISKDMISGRIPYEASEDEVVTPCPDNYFYEVSEGFIHSFNSLAYASGIIPLNSILFELFKCKIPKGTEYYMSDTKMFVYQCASKKIIFKRKMPKILIRFMKIFYYILPQK